jgi:two-component sensor histidine kinase
MAVTLRGYLILSGLSVIGLGVFFALYVLRWETKRNLFTLAVMVEAMLWVFSSIMELISVGLPSKEFWYLAQFVALICAVPSWLAVAAHFTRLPKRQARPLVATAFACALGFLAFFLTNHWHRLAFRSLTVDPQGLSIIKVAGPGYYVYLIYLFTGIITGGVIIARQALESAKPDRRRARTLVAALALPLAAGIVDIAYPEFLGGLDCAPMAAIVTCVVLFVGSVRYRLIDPVPIARADFVAKLVDPVLVLALSGELLYYNESAGLLPGGPAALAERLAKRAAELLDGGQARDGGAESEIELEGRIFSAVSRPIADGHGQEVGILLSLRDVTAASQEAVRLEALVEERTDGLKREIERTRESESALKRSLKEKELLVREVNHRVKNNLQVISSLMRLQFMRATQPEVRGALDAALGRIKSISMVHERMYRGGDSGRVNAADYLRDLVGAMASLRSGAQADVDVSIEADDVELDMDTAVNVGLIVNEAVTNAYKHVFQPGLGSRLKVGLSVSGKGKVLLSIEDDGPGIPESAAAGGADSLGFKIMDAISRQMEGSLEAGRGGFGSVRVVLRIAKDGQGKDNNNDENNPGG